MTITIGWWVIPLILLLVGWLLAWWYHSKNYSPGGYFGDFVTPAVSLGIFCAFALLAIGIAIGKWIAG